MTNKTPIKTYNHLRKHLLASCALLILDASYAHADTVRDVKITGNQRIEKDTILSYVPLRTGATFEDNLVDQTLKDLFATGFFADVHVKKVGSDLIIDVVENASINQIAFEGNKKLKDDKLKEEIQLHPREIVSRAKIVAAQQRIQEMYRQSGRFAATVNPKIIKLDQNRIDLVFEINEGPSTRISNINFIGNKAFKASTLEKQMYTKRHRFYRFFANDDTYDPNRFIADQHMVRQYYLDNGYPDCQVTAAVAELTSNQKDFYLTMTVQEGDCYTIGNVSVVSHVPKIDAKSIECHLIIAKGDTFSSAKTEKSMTKLAEAIGAKGYAFADIQPIIKKNPETKTIDVTFEINEGQRVYVERIDVVGNDRTRDEVIRREIRVQEGDPYNAIYLKRAEKDLQDLDYFKKSEVIVEPGSAPDKAHVTVKVEEKSTGEMGLSGGWSTLDGPMVSVKFGERNFMGSGRIVHAEVMVAKRTQNFDIGIEDPRFLGYNLFAGIDAYRIRSTRISEFTETIVGLKPHMGYFLSEDLFQSWGYIIQGERIHLSRDASDLLTNQEGHYVTSAVTHSISYDKRDSKVEPTSGYRIVIGNCYAGLGGKKIAYFKNSIGASYLITPIEDLTINFRASYAHIDKVKKQWDVRLSDSFFVGADSFRGFEFGGIGPYDKKAKNPLGGTRQWIATVEAVFPIGLPNEFGVKGAVFAEFGSVWRNGLTGAREGLTYIGKNGAVKQRIFDSKATRGTVGIGISWNSPFGPLRIDYGIPVMKQHFDRVQRLSFGFSHRF